MQRLKYVFFDLDGTVFNSELGITESVKYALRKFGIEEADTESLRRFIGPPLKTSFMEYYGFSEDKAIQAVSVYREYYSEKGIFQGTVYPDMEKLLEFINQEEMYAVLATSKPEAFAKRILEHTGLDKYFTFIAGATFDEKRNEKYDVIVYALETLDISDRSAVLMVGDRKYDIEGAKAAGISSAGVLYGFGSEDEFKAAGADHIAADVNALIEIIKSINS